MLCGSMRGLPAGASWFCADRLGETRLQQLADHLAVHLHAELRRITLSGALPGRKPLRRAVRLKFFRRVAISLAETRSAGTCTCMRRSNLPVLSTETCMSDLLA
jgi:hypothetical protein